MIADSQTWYSNGKLLISGEYLVLEGALSLAVPLQVGQSLSVKQNSSILRWNAYKPNGSWFNADLKLASLDIINTDNEELAKKLQSILRQVKKLSPTFLSTNSGFDVVTKLDFNPEYGFGTSSTLISNIARWAKINPYILLKNTFGGSGYDIACATSNNSIYYQETKGDIFVEYAGFNPSFKDSIYFVYLGNKQNSAKEISSFRKKSNFTSGDINYISGLTLQIALAQDLSKFEELISEHEDIMSKILGMPKVKDLYFSDFPGAVKSLGAWGGDFVMLTGNLSNSNLEHYLNKKGFNTYYRYDDIVL